jgi:hypothetical protein
MPASAYYHGGPGAWAWKEVRAAIDSGFPNIEIDDTAGYPSWEEDINAYHFNDPVRRNQLCHYIGVVLAKDKNIGTLKQYEEAVDKGYKPSFTDMSRVDWNYDVFLLNYHGIIDGVSETEFGPAGAVTREQAAVAIAKTAKTLRPSFWQDGRDYMEGKKLTDLEDITPELRNYVGFVMELGIMKGHGDGGFAPKELITHEQMLAVCYRLCNKLDVQGMISVDEASHWLDEYRMNREKQFFIRDDHQDQNAGDLSVYYGGFHDGILEITIDRVTIDGIGELNRPYHDYGDESKYIAVYHAAALDMIKDTFYTARVELTLIMNDGSRRQITDTFVFMY